MDFFSHQRQAKKNSLKLAALYLLAVTVLVSVSTYIILIVLRMLGFAPFREDLWMVGQADVKVSATVAGIVLFGIVISSLVKSFELSKGGRVVALSLGGVKIAHNTDDLHERRVLNVVAEMAIASGMPVPDVYVLKQDQQINAFAAGMNPSDAVIGVTQGAIDKLSRSELQGVMGHEFSHILNGDMRLNMRLITLIAGMGFVSMLGRVFSSQQRSSRRQRTHIFVFLGGLALRLVGWIGVLAGRLIQAAISRQREFLADASSVQFTRNPTGLSSALQKIGAESQTLGRPASRDLDTAHLFFQQTFRSLANPLMATHPDLNTRILRIEPAWNGQWLTEKQSEVNEALDKRDPKEGDDQSSAFDAEQLAYLTGLLVLTESLKKQHSSPAENLLESLQEADEALGFILALLLKEQSQSAEQSQRFLSGVDLNSIYNTLPAVETLAMQWLTRLQSTPTYQVLPLVELAIPALKALSEAQYETLQSLLIETMALDGHSSIYEQVIQQMVLRFLDAHFKQAHPQTVKYRSSRSLALELTGLLALFAHLGHNSRETAEMAFQQACSFLGLKSVTFPLTMPEEDLLDYSAKLSVASEALKLQVQEALLIAAKADGKVNDSERELIIALSATIDVPMPRWP